MVKKTQPFGKNDRKPQRGIFWLTLYRNRSLPQIKLTSADNGKSIWLPKRELWQMASTFQPQIGAFDYSEIGLLIQWPTTGNGNMAAKTEIHISRNMEDSSEIPTEDLALLTMASRRARRSCTQATDTMIDIGNGNVTAKTGNSFIPRTTSVRIEIPTADLRYSISASSKIVCRGDCDNDRQPEIAIWPPKPEVLISLELRQVGSKFQRQIWVFWSRRAL